MEHHHTRKDNVRGSLLRLLQVCLGLRVSALAREPAACARTNCRVVPCLQNLLAPGAKTVVNPTIQRVRGLKRLKHKKESPGICQTSSRKGLRVRHGGREEKGEEGKRVSSGILRFLRFVPGPWLSCENPTTKPMIFKI